MKKILFLIILLTIIFLPTKSFAQNFSVFDTTTVAQQGKIKHDTQMTVRLSENTSITIYPSTFKEDVNIYVYKAKPEVLAKLLGLDQVNIDSFYLLFGDSKKLVKPTIPINVVSANNSPGTDTVFSPMNTEYSIDKQKQVVLSADQKIRVDLPVNDSGFIIASKVNTNATQAKVENNTSNFRFSPINIIIGVLLVITVIGIFYIILKSRI